ncbi:unnamed protein product [Schistocephalus solidus]|uniref:Reverse transcriptase domain-containing protein n=1 Tax=Schistocephalus solidus TaxID=70667 RepID=A0A3P7C1C8_SCHSO|nr:unnamed protein product [Schistocephalus solidus]
MRLMRGLAAGNDGLSARDLLQWSPGAIAGYHNIILAIGHLPAQHCICRTTLVPKVATGILPSNFCQIAVSNVVPAYLIEFLLTGGLASALLPATSVSYFDRQLGFDLAATTVDSYAYADELILFAESPHRLQQILDGLATSLYLAGMALNSAKCASFYV